MSTDNPANPTPGKPPGAGSTARDAERRLKEDAGVLADTARRDFEKVRGAAEGSINEIADQAQEQIDHAAERMKGMAGEQKDLLAQRFGTAAHAVSRVADELRGEQAAAAGYARSIAGGMQRLSDGMREHDVDQIVAIAQDFGRRQPAAFMGAAALAGFAASRFLFATAHRRPEPAGRPATTGYGSTASTYPDGGGRAAAPQNTGGTVR